MISGLLNENFNNRIMQIIKNITLVFTLLFGLTASAQQPASVNYGEDPDKCKKDLTIMLTYYKQKRYEDAARSWRDCWTACPESSKNIYIVGEKVMKHFIKKNKKNAELKDKYVDSLIMVYDQRMKYFPGKTEKSKMAIVEDKGKALAKYRIKESYKEAHELLSKFVKFKGAKTKASTAQMYMYTVKIMFVKGELTCNDVITAYLEVVDIVNANTTGKYKENYERLKVKALDYADKCLDCELLDSLYTADFEANKADTVWLDGGIELLTDKKCTSSEVLVKMMETRFESSPNAKTAIILAQYFRGKQDKTKAAKYFDIAISLEKDNEKLVSYLLKKAQFQNGISQYSGARATANKVLQVDPNNAEAYILIGDAIIYGAGSCKDLKFGGAEVYWVAVDYYNKATYLAGDDATVKSKAANKAAKYSNYFPAKNVIFLQSLNIGDTYQVGCWVNTSTTIREKK